jgi:hypothetical protein
MLLTGKGVMIERYLSTDAVSERLPRSLSGFTGDVLQCFSESI